jgi:hypothetical protein
MLELRHPLAKIEGVKPPEGHAAELRKLGKPLGLAKDRMRKDEGDGAADGAQSDT